MPATYSAKAWVTFDLPSLGAANNIDLSAGTFTVDGLTYDTLDATRNGETFSYALWDQTNDASEHGSGIYDHGTTTLSRTTIERSSNAGAKVEFTGPVRCGLTLSETAWEERNAAIVALESAPPAHASAHITGAGDPIQLATAGQDGLMSQALVTVVGDNQSSISTLKGEPYMTTAASGGLGGETVATTAGVSMATAADAAAQRALLNIEDGATADQSAAEVAYSNATSGLTATELQAAVDEVEGRVDTLETAHPIDLTSDVTGTLPAASGGTGVATMPSGQLVTGAGTSPVTGTEIPAGGLVGETAAATLTQKVLGDYSEATDTASVGGPTIDLDYTLGPVFVRTLTGNITITVTNLPAAGEAATFSLKLIQDVTGGRTIGFTTPTVDWPSGTPPTLSGPSKWDWLHFIRPGGQANFDGAIGAQNYG